MSKFGNVMENLQTTETSSTEEIPKTIVVDNSDSIVKPLIKIFEASLSKHINLDEINKSISNLTFSSKEENKDEQNIKKILEDLSNNEPPKTKPTHREVFEYREESGSKFYRRKQIDVYDCPQYLPIIEEQEEEKTCNPNANVNPNDAAGNILIHHLNNNVVCKINEIKVHKDVTTDEGNVRDIQVDTEVIMEVISYLPNQDKTEPHQMEGVSDQQKDDVSDNKQKCSKKLSDLPQPNNETTAETAKISESKLKYMNMDLIEVCNEPSNNHEYCELENKQKFSKSVCNIKDLRHVNDLNPANSSENNIRKNLHPIFISTDGKMHELLLKHKRVMQLTRPSPYQRFQKCMDLRRYFGGLPNNYECNKHKEENRVPLWMQKYLYDYRRFLRNLQNDAEEESYPKRLFKPRYKPSKIKRKLAFAKICRLCGEKSERFVTTGHNVVIKLVSVYLPLAIIEGNIFPLGLCDKCDYSLALICSFMLTYLDCPRLEVNEKKCFTCGSVIENLLTVVDRKTMQKLATAFYGIRFELCEFFGGGLKYFCNACRTSFELLESFRELIWLTNKVFEDEDERLYESEEISKNQHICEIPPEFYNQTKTTPTVIQKNSIDNCSIEAITDDESYYKESRKWFLKRRQRHMITKFFHRLMGNEFKKYKLKSQKKYNGGKINLKSFFRSIPTEKLNSTSLKNQKYNKYEVPISSPNDSVGDDPVLLSTQSSFKKIDTTLKSISSPNLPEDSEASTSSEKDQSLLQFYLGKMDTSLFEYFNSDVILSSNSSESPQDMKELRSLSSASTEILTDAEVYFTINHSPVAATCKDKTSKKLDFI